MILEKRKEKGFEYIEVGEGPVIVLLHGLMGGLDNFESVIPKLSDNGYKVIGPVLPLFDKPILKTSIKHFSVFIKDFLKFKKLEKVTLFGNSLGGHISLVFARDYPKMVEGLVLTGSSGLYENSMGDTFPRRGDYDYIRKKTEEVFFDPKMATKDLVDTVFKIANDRNSVIRLLTIAKSAIRHNMSNDIPHLYFTVCLVWGKQDNVTPPEVAKEFHSLFKRSDLFWIDVVIHQCGNIRMNFLKFL